MSEYDDLDDLGNLDDAGDDVDSLAAASERIANIAAEKAAEARARMEEGWEPPPRRDPRMDQAVGDWERSCPELYREVTWESISQNTTDEFLNAQAKTERWLERPEGNLLIFGPVGTGKTTLAIAACRELAFRYGWHPRFATATQFFDEVRPEGGSRVEEYIKRRVLLIDDLGAGRNEMTQFESDRLTRLVDERHLNNRITIITSNSNSSTFKAQLGERLYDRILHHSLVVVLNGKSQRVERWSE